jgi:DNA-binding MurR/RpiR family transcriptional regulator
MKLKFHESVMIEQTRESFLGRVRDALPKLHPAERRLGEFLCDFPGELASYDAQELAKLANVSKSTVSRFVRRLGFESYEHARMLAREERQTGSRLFLSHVGDRQNVDCLDAEIAQSKENLDWIFRRISNSEIQQVAQALLNAGKVWVIGFRSSHAFAVYLQWQLTQVIENSVAIPGGGETMAEHIASIAENDCVVFFALRRRLTGTDDIVDAIIRTKAHIAFITDEGAELRQDVSWHLRCQTLSTGPLFNHVSVMALCHQIVTRSIELASSDGRARLRRIEVLNESLGEL